MESRVFAQFLLCFAFFGFCPSTDVLLGAEPSPKLFAAYQQLNAVDFTAREQASQVLQESGRASLPLLTQGLSSEHEEIRWRCASILEKLAVADESIAIQTLETIRNLPAAAAAKFTPLANELLEKSRLRRHELAVQQLRRLGAELNLPEPRMEAFEMEALLFADGVGAMIAEEIAVAVDFGDGFAVDIDGEDAPLLELAVPPIAADEAVEEFAEEDDAAPPLPELAEKIAALVLPGRVEGDLRKALGIPVAAAEDPVNVDSGFVPEKGTPSDFALPQLEPAAELASVLHEPGAFAAAELPEAALELEERHLWLSPLSSVAGDSFELFNLGTIVLDDTFQGSDATLATLSDVQRIGAINIEGKKLTDAALEHFFSIPTLRHLHLQQTGFSSSALLQQHRARPEVGVMAIGPAVMGVNGSLQSAPCRLRAVVPRSGAHQAGLRPGDVIEAIDGEAVRDFSELTILVQSRQPGDELAVTFRRNDQPQTVRVKLAARS